MTRESKDLLVGLDIGTSKVVAIVAEMHSDGEYEVVGIGQHESGASRRAWSSTSRRRWRRSSAALEEAELMAELQDRDGV